MDGELLSSDTGDGRIMTFYIDDKRQPENHFWNCVHGIASDRQITMLLDGVRLVIGGVSYQIVFNEEE